MKRYHSLFFAEDGADFVTKLAAEIRESGHTFRWVGHGRRETWAKITTVWKLGDGQPSWRQYGIMYDLGPRCKGWPRPDGAPSVRPFVAPDVSP